MDGSVRGSNTSLDGAAVVTSVLRAARSSAPLCALLPSTSATCTVVVTSAAPFASLSAAVPSVTTVFGPSAKSLLHPCSQRAPEPRSADHWHRDRLREAAVMRADVHVLVHGETQDRSLAPRLQSTLSPPVAGEVARSEGARRTRRAPLEYERIERAKASAVRSLHECSSMPLLACELESHVRLLELSSSRGVLASLLCSDSRRNRSTIHAAYAVAGRATRTDARRHR